MKFSFLKLISRTLDNLKISDLDSSSSKPGVDAEMQSFLMMEQQKAQFQAMVIIIFKIL